MATRKVADKKNITTGESDPPDDSSSTLLNAIRLGLRAGHNEGHPVGLPEWEHGLVSPRLESLRARWAELEINLKTRHPAPAAAAPQTGPVKAPRQTNVSKKVRYPEYDKMFKNGRFESTIALGYDEGGFNVEERSSILKGLLARGFVQVQLEGGRTLRDATDQELQSFGLDPARVDRTSTYFVKPFTTKEGKQVQAVVRLIDSGDPHPKRSFADAFANDSFVLYAGHARYGTGPDFDDEDSPDGNFVLGDAYVKKAATGPNDLQRTEMTPDYQFMVFAACKSKHYTNDLRNIPKNKTTQNLDFLTSAEKLSWNLFSDYALAALDGVMAQQSVGEIQASLAKIEGLPFIAEGFGDNRYQPPRD